MLYMLNISKGVQYAFISGLFGAIGSMFGKLSGGLPGLENLWWVNLGFFIIMIFVNTYSMTYFVKALQNSGSSLQITLFSSATNYLTSAVLGLIVFKEVTKLLWWFGTSCIILGLYLVSQEEEYKPDAVKLKNK